MTVKEQFDEWLSQCPVDYCEVFGRNTYRFEVPRENVNSEEDSSQGVHCFPTGHQNRVY